MSSINEETEIVKCAICDQLCKPTLIPGICDPCVRAQEGRELFYEPEQCEIDWCHEAAWRNRLCFQHYVEEEDAKWDDEDAERATCLEGVGVGGYIFVDRYKERKARALWHELKYVYPNLAPPDKQTPEDAAKAVIELFG